MIFRLLRAKSPVKALCFISFFLLISFFSGAQIWIPKTKLGETNITNVCFQDKDTGYILSSSRAYRTTDGGESWNRILNSYSNFSKCHFTDSKHGWIIGMNNLVLRTTDGGVSWNSKNTSHSAIDPTTIYSWHKDTMFFLAAEDMNTNKFGMFVYYTFDGGSNWSRTSTGSTQTMRGLYHWDKNRGIIGALTMGVFRTSNGWSSYSNNSSGAQNTGLSVIQDSVVVVVGNNGVIARSTNYGASFSTVSSPVTSHLTSVHFSNDTFGMACGNNGVVLVTKDGGRNWSRMVTQSTLNFQTIFVHSPLYAFAVVSVTNADSFQVFRFGNKSLFSEKINYIEGSLIADVNKNCRNDNGEQGASNILIKASPGPYYTYTTAKGQYSLAIPDTGKFKIEAFLPEKLLFGNGLCDTLKDGIYFNSYEQWATGVDFMYDADTSFKLDIKICSSRKRRCAWNSNIITYRNIGSRLGDSTEITIFYPSNLISLKKHTLESTRGDGFVTLKTGKLLPDQQGQIELLDSVLCRSGVMGLTVCMRVQITPQKIVQKTIWDSSWIRTRIDCLNDSIAIVKLFNSGKQMGDSTGVVVYLDEDPAGEIRYKLGEHDSLRFEVLRRNQTLTVLGDINKHHPYYEQMRLWRERCGDETRNTTHSVVTTFELEKFPPFEDEFCLPIRDSYDPNDITVTPNGRGDDHWVKKDGRLNYHIRFQNTGNDTAYNVYIIDTLPDEVDPRSIELKGSSHKYMVSLSTVGGKNILRFDFNNIYLVDSATNEPGSNGWINFDINMIKGLKHRRKISNFVDIYFDFNDPVRTNTAWVQIYDTIIQPIGKGVILDCQSRFVKHVSDSLICNQNQFDFTITAEGKNKGYIRLIDTTATLIVSQDTLFSLTAPNEGVYRIETSIWDCDAHKVDTIQIHFMNAPETQLQDSIHCGQVSQILHVSCYACSYLWNTDSTQAALSIKQNGIYTVKMENSCGAVVDTARIDLIPFVQLDLGNDTLLCDVSTHELKNTKQPITLLWPDASNSLRFMANKDGWYQASYTDQCNHLNDRIHLRFRTQPSLQLGNDTVLCDQNTLRIDLPNPDAEHIFRWENNDNQTVRTLSQPGTYSVTAKNLCGIKSDTLVITKLSTPEKILRDTAFCGNNGVFIPITQTNNQEVLIWQDSLLQGSRFFYQPGIYQASLENACGSTSQQIEIKQFSIPVASFTIDNPCRTDSVIIVNLSRGESTDQLFYSWFLNGVFASAATQPAFYFADSATAKVLLIVQTDKGCSDSSIQTFNKKDRVSADFDISGFCLGDSTRFINQSTATNNNKVQYQWTFGDGNKSNETNPVHVYQGQSGTYLVILRASFEDGCRDSVVIPVNIEEKPSANFTYELKGRYILLNVQDFSASNRYRWKIAGQDFTDSLNWQYPVQGTYFRDSICLLAEDQISGCDHTTCVWIDMQLAETEHLIKRKLGVYPNPGKNVLHLDIPGSGPYVIKIHDARGQQVSEIQTPHAHDAINIGSLSAGVYFIEVNGIRGEQYHASFLKMH